MSYIKDREYDEIYKDRVYYTYNTTVLCLKNHTVYVRKT